VNGTYAMLLELPYLSDYKVNPTLDKLITALGGVNNFNNNALNSFIAALLFQDAVNKAAATGTLNRQTLFAALKDEHSFTADGIVGPTDIGGHVGPTCEVLVQLQNGVWNRVDPVAPGTFDCNAANSATIKYAAS